VVLVIDHGVPRNELFGKSTEILHSLYKQKGSRSSKKKSNLLETESCILSHFPDMNQFIDPFE
jgi:hypothetical protein